MRIPSLPPDDQRARRLEISATRSPSLYKARLALLAILGDALLTLVRVFPFAISIVLGMLLFPHPALQWIGLGAIVLLTWIVRPNLRLTGEVLPVEAAPELHATMDRLRGKIDVPGPVEIALSDDMNASVQESRGLFGVLGVRRRMHLGIPLLANLSRGEVEAVIAHELGHLSRRHGRLGHWLYRAHMGWRAHAETMDAESTALDRIGDAFARLFVPYFGTRAMVWSRRCEFEADASAAQATSAAHLVSALARLAVHDRWERCQLGRELVNWQRAEARPPADMLERMATSFMGAPPASTNAWLREELARPANWSDSHPSTEARAKALSVAPALLPVAQAAGPALLNDRWPDVASGWAARWQQSIRAEWGAAHARWRLIEKALVEANADDLANWPVEPRLMRAKAIARLEPVRGRAELAQLVATYPDSKAAAFALQAAELSDGHAHSAAAMQGLAEADPRFRVPTYLCLARWCRLVGDFAGEDRWLQRRDLALARRRHALELAAQGVESGSARASPMRADVLACLAEAMSHDLRIAKAWLVRSDAPLAAGSGNPVRIDVDVLVLVIVPFASDGRPADRDEIHITYRNVLAEFTPVENIAIVLSYYTTEPLPERLAALVRELNQICAEAPDGRPVVS